MKKIIPTLGLGLLLIGYGCNKQTPSIESTNELGISIEYKGTTTEQEYKVAKHGFDITGDGVEDTYCVDEGKFKVWPGNLQKYTNIVENYGPGFILNDVPYKNMILPRARKKNGNTEILIRHKKGLKTVVDVWKVKHHKPYRRYR